MDDLYEPPSRRELVLTLAVLVSALVAVQMILF
jgi:hypothetical protein